MYNVNKKTHIKYGHIVEITREDIGIFVSPYLAANKARVLYREISEGGAIKVRIFVDDEVITLSKLNSWANEEYNSLPKCNECAKLLNEMVYIHNYSKESLFCSQKCADNNYSTYVEKMNDYEDSDFR